MLFRLRSQQGFTLVELVTVLVLLGVLSAVAFSRLGNVDSYRDSLFQNQLLSYLRLAQRSAVAHQGSVATLTLTRTNAESWNVSLSFGSPLQSLNYTLAGENGLSYISGATNGSLSVSDTLALQFDDDGDLNRITSPVVATVSQSLSLSLNAARQLCISPTGFAYEGSCL